MKQRELITITAILNLAVIALSFFAWVSYGHSLTAISIASLLAITAFSLMWVHYVSDFVKQTWFPDQSTGWQYNATHWFVLIAILLHPFLVNFYLVSEGYGFPPGSYVQYLGVFSALFVPLGFIALALFLLYEFKKWFARKQLGYFVDHASILAMFLVLIHGFQLGFITSVTWFYWVWWVFLVTFTALAIRYYAVYYKNMSGKKYFVIAVVLALAGIGAFVGYSKLQLQEITDTATQIESSDTKTQPQTTTNETTAISKADLALNNGKDGNKCWIAIDGEVYDASNNPQWQNGEHLPSGGRAKCGQDLTSVISQSPHGKSVLGELPIVGALSQ